MLKPKHYPHATVAGAVLLTVAPVSLLFLSALWRPPAHADYQKSVSTRAASDSSWQPDEQEPQSRIASEANRPAIISPNSSRSPDTIAPENTVVDSDTFRTPAADVPPLRPFTEGTSILSVRADKPGDLSAADPLDSPTQQATESRAPRASMLPELTAEPLVVAANKPANLPEDAKQESVEELEYPEPPVVSESYFMATGHLALADVAPTVPEAPPAEEAAAANSESGEPVKPKKTDIVQKNGGQAKKSEPTSPMASAPTPTVAKGNMDAGTMAARDSGSRTVPLPTPATAVVPDFGEDEFFGTTGKRSRTESVGGPGGDEYFEDVILQTPLETRQVGRVENVIGVTGARGFPIALVRSDLPDDDWWVQQMVGMRGNTFAARVNFGNDESISGSVYHMVVVFLDSPDEARRFRIAKRFDELPEGIRRSREFRYVRK